MPNITGPVGMMLGKNGVRYPMVADRHTYNFDGCAQGLDAIMIQDYLIPPFSKENSGIFILSKVRIVFKKRVKIRRTKGP